MPALLSSLSDFEGSLAYATVAAYLGSASPGYALLQASADVEDMCDRRLAAPPTGLTVGTGGASAGAFSLPVSSAVNIHGRDVLVFAGGEAVEVTGAEVTAIADPYPGTVSVLTPLGSGYAAGTGFAVYRQEQYLVRGKSTDSSGSAFPESQEGQMAQMHAPYLGRGLSGRVIMLRQYPVQSLHAAYESLPSTNTETLVDLSACTLMREAGWYRLPVGFYNPVSTVWRTQYSAGYTIIPYGIRDAVHLLAAYRIIRTQNPMGATAARTGDASFTAIGAQYLSDATRALAPYIRAWA